MSAKDLTAAGWEVRLLCDTKNAGDTVSLLAPEGETSDSIEFPSDAEVASLAGVRKVRFADAGDHPSRVETLYTVVRS